jgi:hypothetical protein
MSVLSSFYKPGLVALPNDLGDKAGCFAICGLIALAIAALLVIGLNAEGSDQLAEKIHTVPGRVN